MLQKYKLTWNNDSVGLTEQRIYEQVDWQNRVRIGTVDPDVFEYTFEKDYGESAELKFFVESVGIVDGLESRQLSTAVEHTIVPVVEPFIFIANPKNRTFYNQIVLEDHDRIEVVGHPEIKAKHLGGWLYELWLPINTDEDFEIRVYPEDNTKPIGAISFNNMLKEIVQWSSAGHKVTTRDMSVNFKTDNPYFIYSTGMLTKVPEQLHPSITNLDYFFKNANIETDISQWDVSNVTSMRGTFLGSRMNWNYANWDVSNVTNMSDMFRNSRYNYPLNNWDMSSVTNISGMFRDNTAFNQPLDLWNTSNFTNISYAFAGAVSFNGNISTWDVSNVTDASYAFSITANFNSDITTWNTTSFINMEGMFKESIFNQGIGVWNTANVTNMSHVFEEARVFNFPLTNWDTAKVTTMSAMFRSANKFNQPLNHFDVSSVVDMAQIFTGTWVFDQPLDTWDVSNVVTFKQAFEAAQIFNHPLNMWNITSAVDLSEMFAYAYEFNQPLDQWDLVGVETTSGMFRDAREFNQPLNDWDMSTVKSVSYMFSGAEVFNQPLNEWNTDEFLYIEGTFRGATQFNEDISTWNISQVKSLAETFSYAVSFNGDITQWNTSIVTHMQKAFQGAKAFNQDITGWDTIRVVDMSDMFNGAIAFAQPIGNWRVGNVSNMDRMFNGVNTNINLTSWCVSNIATRPVAFSGGLTVNEPVWSTCPSNVDEDPYVPLTLKIADAPEGFSISGSTPFVVKIYGYPDQESAGVDWNATYNRLTDTKHYPENTVLYIYPKDREQPLTGFEIGTCQVKEIVAWNESGHASVPGTPHQQSFKTKVYGPLVLNNSGATLEKVPETLHPSIRSLYGIFHNAKNLKAFPNNWDTSNVIDMGGAFYNFTFPDNTDLSNWDTSNVKNMSGMFMSASGYNVNFADLDVSNVTDMSYMFYGAIGFTSEDWSKWDVSKVTDMNHMFGNIYFNPNISDWQTSSLTDMSYMFYKASQFNQPLNDWDVSKVTNMHSAFREARKFNQPLNEWDVSKVTWFYNMFEKAEVFNQPLGNWNVANSVSFRYMFYEAMAYNQDLTQWCTTNIYEDYYNRADFINTNMQTTWSTSLQPVWGTCPRGEDQEMYCVPDVVELKSEALVSTSDDLVGFTYQIDDQDEVAVTVALGDAELNNSDALLVAAAKSGNRSFLELVLGTLSRTETTLSSQSIAPLTYSSGGTIVFKRNTNSEVTIDLFDALFETEDDTLSLTTCMFGTIKTITLPSNELSSGIHIRSASVINRKNTLVYNSADEYVGTLEQFLASEDIVVLIDTDNEVKVKHVTDSLSGYKILSAQTLENVPFFIIPEIPEMPGEEDTSFKPMLISGNISTPTIYSHSPLDIKYPQGTTNISQQTITEGVERPLYAYTATLGMPGYYSGRIEVSHIDHVSPIDGFALPYAGSYIEQWYSGGYVSFISDAMYAYGIRGASPYLTRVPDVAPPNTTNMTSMFGNASSFRQDLSTWCVTDITEEPTNFEPYGFPPEYMPVWGTCPVVQPDTDRLSMVVEFESSSVAFYSKTPLSIAWGPLAAPEDHYEHYLEGDIHVYIREYGDEMGYVNGKQREIRLIAEDGVSQLVQFGMSGIGAVRQWYGNGYDGFMQSALSSVKYLPYAQPPKTTNYSNMFSLAYYASAPTLEDWDMSEATNLSYMFYSNPYFNSDISRWNVGNVTNMGNMFYAASAFNQDMSQWCVGLIKRKPSNFDTGTQLVKAQLPVWGTCPRGEVEFPPEEPTDPGNPGTDPSGYIGDWMEITETYGALYIMSTTELEVDWGPDVLYSGEESEEQTIEGDTPETYMMYAYTAQYSEGMEATTIAAKIRPKSGEGPIENLTIQYASAISKWYKGGYTSHIYGGEFDLGNGTFWLGPMIQSVPPVAPPNTTSLAYMFAGSQFDGDISGWDVSQVTDMTFMFAENVAFNQDISGWNVSNVTDMTGMFGAAQSFTQDLSQWCVANITEEPEDFANNAGLTPEQYPVWGTCPRGENVPVAGPGEIISVRYVPKTPESDMRLGEYAEYGAVITYPTEAELLPMSRGNGGVLLYSDNDVEFNLNYNKAIPFTVIDYSDMLLVTPYLPNIPIVLSNNIVDYIYNNPEDERTIMNITMGTPYGDEEMAISSQMALEEFFYGIVPLGDSHQALLVLGEYTNMFAYSAGGDYNFMSMNVVNPDDDTVVGEFTFNPRPERVIPDPMNNFKLIEGDAITFTLDKNINALAVVWAYTEGDTWSNELLNALIPCQEEAVIEAEEQIYHVTYNDNVITLSTMEDGHDDRVTRDVGVWLYIPNETVNVQSVSQNVDIDVKHFSTGTCIYFYLAALNN